MRHHKPQLRSRVSPIPPKQNKRSTVVESRGVKRYAYAYQTDSNFTTEFPLTSDDLAKMSAFVREFEACALAHWLGQHYERRKERMTFDIGEMNVILPHFGKMGRMVPDWRRARARGFQLIALMRGNADAWAWYQTAFHRMRMIRFIRKRRLRARHLRAMERVQAIRAIRRARLNNPAPQVQDVPLIGHDSQ
jgi:hypothetical protein